MINPPKPHDHEAHAAWLDSLSPDELNLMSTPPGYLWLFVIIALTKRALMTKDIKPAEKLSLLENLNGMTDLYLTPAMLAVIEPMGDVEYAIFKEAKSLDAPTDKAAQASFNVLTSPRVAWHLATLNPSILSAIKLKGASRCSLQA